MFRGSQGQQGQQGQKGQSILSGCCAALMKCRRSGSREGGAHSSVTTTATLAIMPVVPAAVGDHTDTSREETFDAAAGSTVVTLGK